MRREFHVRFCEGPGVRSPRATRLVICCTPGFGTEAMATMRALMARIGLQVNDRKTHLARLPEDRFDFLGTPLDASTRRTASPTWEPHRRTKRSNA
jgi:hypothetical protein